MTTGWNLKSFRLTQIEIERDYAFDGWSCYFVILGLGLYFRFNSGKSTPESEDIEERINNLIGKASAE